MALRMRKVMARPGVGVRVRHMLSLFIFSKISSHADPHNAHHAVFLWDEPERYGAWHNRLLGFLDFVPILTNIYSPRACAQWIHKTKN